MALATCIVLKARRFVEGDAHVGAWRKGRFEVGKCKWWLQLERAIIDTNLIFFSSSGDTIDTRGGLQDTQHDRRSAAGLGAGKFALPTGLPVQTSGHLASDLSRDPCEPLLVVWRGFD